MSCGRVFCWSHSTCMQLWRWLLYHGRPAGCMSACARMVHIKQGHVTCDWTCDGGPDANLGPGDMQHPGAARDMWGMGVDWCTACEQQHWILRRQLAG
mmetsp:Transcript_26027/g.56782  ORF Transcript_26027/g.56782 Transcript_26027/m.56782 type:complete len:98 (-) Transcript_26027:415-708(-)